MQIQHAHLKWGSPSRKLVEFIVIFHIGSILIIGGLFSQPVFALEGESSPPARLEPALQAGSPQNGWPPEDGHRQVSHQVAPEFPDLEEFIARVTDGENGAIRGVYLADVFALPVIQQPEDKPVYVSNRNGLITQFRMAANYGVTGLLAHNYLSGKEFFKLHPGQEVSIVYGDSLVRRYKIAEIGTFQKLDPARLHSDYLDLSTGRQMSASEVFKLFYRGEHHLTFQTCLEKDGLLNWGLLFVLAVPLES